jgi:enoyl-CoA hydratase/carnithine racemase
LSSFSTLTVDAPAAAVLIATLNRPERLNAMTAEMFADFVALQQRVESDPMVRVLVLTGAGRGFCAGLDLDEAAELPRMPASAMLALQQRWADAIAGFRLMTKPVIAAVNGAAAGAGMCLALVADIRVASQSARFNAAFVRIGLSGGDLGSSWLLPRLIGFGRASELLLTGRFVDAEEALRVGMVNAVASADTLLEEALSFADAICANAPFGVALTKQVLQMNVDAASLGAALSLENRNQVLATRSADMSEALAAFREKRQPRFTGA